MKKSKTIKKIFIILTIILLSMISFVGIYVQDKNEIKNIMPEYLLARDIEGHRRVELKISDEITETIKYDAEGNVIGDSDTETTVARIEEKKVNTDEVLTEENYDKSKEIIEKRLKIMQVEDYIIRKDTENGTIILELPENSDTDRVIGQLSLQGKFEIVDNDTNETLMANSDLKSVQAGYGTTETGTTAVFINIQFNKEGTEKLKNITNTYIQTAETNDESEEETTKKIAIKVDDTTLLTTYFDETISNGLLQLTVGYSTNSTTEELQEYLLEANSMATVLDAGKMTIIYEVEQNKYIFSDITMNEIGIAISVIIVIATIGMIYLIIKYKTKGILASISLIGYVAILLIAIRFFNVKISVGGIVGIILSIAINYFILTSILKQENVLSVIKKYLVILIPTLVIAIVLTFMNISLGITVFWGIVISLLYNLSITNILLKD